MPYPLAKKVLLELATLSLAVFVPCMPALSQVSVTTDSSGRRIFTNTDGKLESSLACSQAQESLSSESLPAESTDTSAIKTELESLVRRYTSTLDVRAGRALVGKLRLVWLNPKLLAAVVQQYAETNSLSAIQANQLKRKLAKKLESDQAIPFLMIVQPGKGSLIGSPAWASDDQGRNAPAVFLRGTGNRIGAPYKWTQILGEGKTFYYSEPTWGYLLYKAVASDGRKLIHPDDFSFSVEVRSSAALCEDTMHAKIYDLEITFQYDLMPIQVQQVIDKSIPSWNSAVASIRERRLESRPDSAYSSAQGYVTPAFYAQGNPASLSRSEILQIVGLAIAFAQLLVALGA